MKLPSDPTTWDNIARICRNADEYIERHYSDEEPEEKRKNYGEFLEVHHSIRSKQC